MSRKLLHKTKLADFKDWLISDGWEIDDNNGEWQVLRARKGSRFLAVYDRFNTKEHYTVQGKDEGVIRAYIRARKGELKCEQK